MKATATSVRTTISFENGYELTVCPLMMIFCPLH
jgi:hypothetical protein